MTREDREAEIADHVAYLDALHDEVARAFATSKGSMILWGMGISQHIHGTDNARCLIALCLMTGQVGKPGTGLHPLRGQNNVQGACDMSVLFNYFAGYTAQPNHDVQTLADYAKSYGTFRAKFVVNAPNPPSVRNARRPASIRQA